MFPKEWAREQTNYKAAFDEQASLLRKACERSETLGSENATMLATIADLQDRFDSQAWELQRLHANRTEEIPADVGVVLIHLSSLSFCGFLIYRFEGCRAASGAAENEGEHG